MENLKTLKKNFIALVSAWKDNQDVLSMIERNMGLLLNYVCAVYNMEIQLPILNMRLEGEDFRDAVQDLDRRRRHAHDAAISGTAALCRMAAAKNVAPMFDGIFDAESRNFDRNIVGDFCMAAVDALVMDRTTPVTIQSMLDKANE